ncbi:hypothetical protein L9F63_014729, partial [Diploptera punctata]
CGVLTIDKMCEAVKSVNSVNDGKGDAHDDSDDEVEPEAVPSFVGTLRGFETMSQFIYSHITEKEKLNIFNIESLLFNLNRKGANKQKKINNYFMK